MVNHYIYSCVPANGQASIRPPVAYKFYVRNDRGWSRGTGYGTSRKAADTLDKSPVRTGLRFDSSWDSTVWPNWRRNRSCELTTVLSLLSGQVWGSIPHETLPFERHEAGLSCELTTVFFLFITDYILKLRTSTCVLSRNALVAMVYIGLLFSCSP